MIVWDWLGGHWAGYIVYVVVVFGVVLYCLHCEEEQDD